MKDGDIVWSAWKHAAVHKRTGRVVAHSLEHLVEDRINTLLTRDPNKEKVYKDGYDGHCLRAYSYFGTQMPDIINTVDSINSIKKKYR